MQAPSGASLVPPPSPRRFPSWVALLLAAAAGFSAVYGIQFHRHTVPDVPTVVERMRDVARLETLEVSVYKKVGYAPEPLASGNIWTDVFRWAKAVLAPSHGRAIVFGTVHVGLDLSHLDANALLVHGSNVEVRLPALQTRAEVRPAETEIIQSNLDSAETAQLLELARVAFEQDARADTALQARARASAERALRGLLFSLGFQQVRFVEGTSGPGGTG